MVLLWRIWLRAALVVTMALGCAMAEPVVAAPDAVPAFHMAAGCHGATKGGAGTTLGCHACLAVPIRMAQLLPPAALPQDFAPPLPRAFAGRGFAPATPPPRSA